MLNLAGALVYLMVAALAVRAARASRTARRPRSVAVHWRTIALLFAGLAVWRLAGGEALVQEFGRNMAHGTGSYALRRDWQIPLVSLTVIAAAAFAVGALFGSRGDRNVHWSRFATVSLLAYSVVRMVSLHAVDAIIYASAGPIHVNHLIDLGLAATVGYFAVASARRA